MVKALAILLFAQVAHAATFTVKCTSTYNNKKETIQIRLSDKGKIVPWDSKVLCKAPKDSLFSNFSGREDDGIEYSNTFVARNGFALVNVGTTADDMTIGVHPKTLQAFYNYRDTGSGAGNFKLTMTCIRN